MQVVRFARMCVAEARPVVQIVFLMRFVTGLLFQVVALQRRPGIPIDPVHLLLGPIAWTLAVLAVYLVNGVMDVAEDRANGSSRPIASGALPLRAAATVVVLLAVLALAFGAAVPGLDWCVAGMLLLGHLYSGPPLPAKRTTLTAAATVVGMGLLTYLGGALSAGGSVTTGLLVFGGAMSAWMGCVGAVSKDLGDIPGDAVGGRRTLAVVHGERAARRTTAVGALAVGAAALGASALWAPLCLAGTVPLAAGAVWVALRCRRPDVGRAPYRAFMITQYAAHASMIAALLARLLFG
ncbi:4-hydroxybenzoate polyprenyltransferase/chlorophyll synthase/homogentisate solanesyltransferase/geranylgeranylglycerol-phosphate geranylgeranyltransferase [Streptacidiphilus jiangxiensis]|uniref:4-hydroxybenzoate polyprenyltransferase/chlorophyll synthase/homogentisate solanesyltransferase/geranylgeranylglycerol-phosphate geranylgeranyltransferase n=2 Tax=Streptacidiphilus jiangxiensis TaxID=235985 RepID=A0A1H8ACD5_STRJI|nr:4-hydroxybenzoate polyprenyltransferase/chlorophyll synthase/homogentisate solanesyltransferase/geranylgeranylglycerol-phosphate geranylgeranyltransferase [Streptacidiphilus jiangxiensis]